MMMMSVSPARTASSTTYWIAGVSSSGSISLGCALVAGRNRVPSPAAGMTAFRTLVIAPPLRGPGVYPSEATRRPSRSVMDTPIHLAHADLRVRVLVVRPAHRGLPALLGRSTDHMRRVRGQAPQGVPPRRHRVQGLGVLRHGQPFGRHVGLEAGRGRTFVFVGWWLEGRRLQGFGRLLEG